MLQYPDFQSQGPAPCTETDPDAYFPEPEASGSIARSHQARELCYGCKYILECYQWAMENDEPGIWGGTTLYERKAIKRKIYSGRAVHLSPVRISPMGLDRKTTKKT